MNLSLRTPVEFQAKPSDKTPMRIQMKRLLTVLCLVKLTSIYYEQVTR